jgi:4-alpha-glucanotransferase
VAAEEARARIDRLELVELLRGEGLVTGEEPGEDQLVVAIHALLARSRSRLVLISPYDVVGEVRQPNLPGTVDEYPNWRLPLPVSLEELREDPRVRVVVDQLRIRRP